MGADRLAEHIKGRLGIDFHQTSADGRYTLEPVFCLGAAEIQRFGDKRHGGRVDVAEMFLQGVQNRQQGAGQRHAFGYERARRPRIPGSVM
jgi:hypothetical protein